MGSLRRRPHRPGVGQRRRHGAGQAVHALPHAQYRPADCAALRRTRAHAGHIPQVRHRCRVRAERHRQRSAGRPPAGRRPGRDRTGFLALTRGRPAQVESFSPTRPAAISSTLTTRMVDTASPNSTMLEMNAPSAPIPTHTAYAVPRGRLFIATDNSQTLTTMLTSVMAEGIRRVNPCVYFRPTAHTTSNSPAKTRMTQVMLNPI